MKKTILFIIAFSLIFTATQNLIGKASCSGVTQVELKDVEPFVYVSLRHKGPFSDIEDVIADLIITIKSLGVLPQGPMIGIFHTVPGPNDPADMEMEWEVGFPISEGDFSQVREEMKAKLKRNIWQYPLVASTQYSGPYRDMGETITDIFQWMESKGYDKAGPVLATFLETGTPDAPPSELKGEIWIPCKK